MIRLLARCFIKDYTHYSDTTVREHYGVLCGIVGVVLNCLLFTGKFIFGIVSSSVAITADAFNNLSDAATSIVSIAGFKLSQRAADAGHPFGHGRLEYVAGLAISFFIVSVGVQLLKSSFTSLFDHSTVSFSMASVVMLVAAIVVKLYMFCYNTGVSRLIASVALKATARDSLSDIVGTALVLASLVASRYTSFPVDSVAGFVVAGFIIYTGITSAIETTRPLLGEAPTHELVSGIKEELLRHKPIMGMHDLVVHNYGPGHFILSLHAEVPGDEDIFSLHEVIDRAEMDISHRFKCQAVIHMDPIDIHNSELALYRSVVEQKAALLGEGFTVHDIRMVPGRDKSNLIFDLVVPFSHKSTDNAAIITQLRHSIEGEYPKLHCVITPERPYC